MTNKAIPHNNYTNESVLADWIELWALSTDHGVVDRGAVIESLRDSGLFENGKFNKVNDIGDKVWDELKSRRMRAGASWPFRIVQDSQVIRFARNSHHEIGYKFLLTLGAAVQQHYKTLKITKHSEARTVFEYLVQVALESLSLGKCFRLGTPIPNGWPKKFSDRVERLARELGISTNRDQLAYLASPSQNDDSLDVCVQWKLKESFPGVPYLLCQCATSSSWQRQKLGEPNVELWKKYLNFDGPVMSAIAIPFQVRTRDEMSIQTSRHGRIILDRFRLAKGLRKTKITPELLNKLDHWGNSWLAAVPDD